MFTSSSFLSAAIASNTPSGSGSSFRPTSTVVSRHPSSSAVAPPVRKTSPGPCARRPISRSRRRIRSASTADLTRPPYRTGRPYHERVTPWLLLLLSACGAAPAAPRAVAARPPAPARAVEVLVPQTRGAPIAALGWASDDQLVTVGEELRLWDAPSGALRGAVPLPEGGGHYLAVSPRGTSAVTLCGRTEACVIDLVDGRVRARLRTDAGGEPNTIAVPRFSPDGETVGVQCDYGISPDEGDGGVTAVCLFGLDGALRLRVEGERIWYASQPWAFRPDGGALIVTCGEGLCVHDTRTAELLATAPEPGDGTRSSLALGRGGQLLALSDAGTVYVRELASGREIARHDLPEEAGEPVSLSLSPDGRALAIGSAPAGVLRLDLDVEAAHPIGDYDGRSVSVEYGPDGTTLLVRWALEGRWGIAVHRPDGERLLEVSGAGPPAVAAFRPDGRALAFIDAGGRASVLDVAPGASPRALGVGGSSDTALAVHPDGRLAAGGHDGAVRVFGPGGELLRVLPAEPERRVLALGWVGDELLTVSAPSRPFAPLGGSVRLRRTRGAARGEPFDASLEIAPTFAAVGPGGVVAVAGTPHGGWDGQLFLLDPTALETTPEPRFLPGPVGAIAFHPRRDAALVGMHGGSLSMQTLEGEDVVLESYDGPDVTALAFRPDGARAAVGRRDGSIEVRAIPSGERVGALGAPSPPSAVTSLAPVGPDELAVGHRDGRVHVLRLPDGRLRALTPAAAAARSLAVGFGGALVEASGVLRVHRLSDGAALTLFATDAGALAAAQRVDGRERLGGDLAAAPLLRVRAGARLDAPLGPPGRGRWAPDLVAAFLRR